MEKVWEIFSEELAEVNLQYDFQIHSFVLMSNHFHLIASTPQSNISQCMWHLMYHTSKRITRSGNRINETYAGRYYKCILQDHSYYLNAYKYNYRNPISAGLCERVQDYKFSTLAAVMGKARSIIPVVEDLTYMSSPEETLLWLNQKPDDIKLEAARWGFKRTYFKSKKCIYTNKPILDIGDIL